MLSITFLPFFRVQVWSTRKPYFHHHISASFAVQVWSTRSLVTPPLGAASAPPLVLLCSLKGHTDHVTGLGASAAELASTGAPALAEASGQGHGQGQWLIRLCSAP